MHQVGVLSDNQEDITGSEVGLATAINEFPIAEPRSHIGKWVFRILIIIGLALVVYTTFTGRLFQPLFQSSYGTVICFTISCEKIHGTFSMAFSMPIFLSLLYSGYFLTPSSQCGRDRG
jgi:hypothetical protein